MGWVLANKRVVAPLLAAVLCFFAGGYTGPVLTLVLTVVAFGFIMDAVTLLWSRSGGLSQHRQ